MQILSIDAWAGDFKGMWDWNSWQKVGTITKEDFEKLTSNRKVLIWARAEGYLSEKSKGKCSVFDDGYNLVIINNTTREPLYALAYGEDYD